MAAAIKREFEGLIPLDDVPNNDARSREQNLLSRGLAALVARSLTGCDTETAASFVVDGFNDYGIDAVAIMDGAPRIWLIQSKWSDKGTAAVGEGEALKMVNGFKRISHKQYDRLSDKYRRLADRINMTLDHPRAQVTLLVAVMGEAKLSQHVQYVFEDAKREHNWLGDDLPLDYGVVGAREAWQMVRSEAADAVELRVPMTQWHRMPDPYEAFEGSVSAAEVAQWYQEHGGRLFAQNIRQWLGFTSVNSQIVRTLLERPEAFWYFNNGITILCDGIDAIPFNRADPRSPMTLTLSNASVVNGAQTVTSCHEALSHSPAAGVGAQVSVKIISMKTGPEGFAAAITKANNTQNHVEQRDFVALDPVQAEIRDDFQLTLEMTYVFRRGEMDPPREVGCSIVEAGMSLLCAHRDPALSVKAKADPDELWRPEGGIYPRLFRRPPGAAEIWRTVQLHRVIREALHETRRSRLSRAASVTEHGDLLLAHVIFQHVGLSRIDDGPTEWADFLKEVPELVASVVDLLTHHIDTQYSDGSYIRSTFANEARGRELVGLVLNDLEGGVFAPETVGYRKVTVPKPRKPNTVATLVQANRISAGTQLTFFYPPGGTEEEALRPWLDADPKRGIATWTNKKTKPLIWAADGKEYSPTGLVMTMWKLACWDGAPVAVQGTARWSIPSGENLVWLANEVLATFELEEGAE
ncbi:AIPR family protein [Actinoallomurus sp. CA-150999]|uniref:AIPR family protein n=1 Tax=Actinoallomurus sp. CA-150999 TaxID=3239887 RepID=UPI003D8B550F